MIINKGPVKDSWCNHEFKWLGRRVCATINMQGGGVNPNAVNTLYVNIFVIHNHIRGGGGYSTVVG